MSYTAWCFFIGCICISALPPFNGFVSEWLFFQTALQATTLKSEITRTLIPVAAALIALTGALAAACFVKVYGVAFLGQPRSLNIKNAHDPQLGMRFAMGLLALLCLSLGILPTFTISALSIISQQLIHTQLLPAQNWMWLIPINAKTASYSAILIGGGVVTISLLVYCLLRMYYGRTETKTIKPWDCGYGDINQRMQYSAMAFAMPIRRIFQNLFILHEKIEKIGGNMNYSLRIKDLTLQYIYLPLESLSFELAKSFARIQGGNVRIYLTYIFITLILLLWTTTQFG